MKSTDSTVLEYESPPSGGEPADRLSVGTLRYTTAGLVAVFFWLLWGDFVFTLMEAVVPSIVPLRLKELHAPDWALMIIMTTTPHTLNFILNPIISTASDRHRGPLGRRVPYLLFSTPFITLALVLMAFSPEIGQWSHVAIGRFTGWSESTVAIITLAALFIVFQVTNLFITTVFYYFFNDVVPTAFMARFMGLFRVVGSLAGMLYNYYVYEHALTHMRIIFLGAAGIYFVGFMSMCFGIKEGQYPPIKSMASGFAAKFGTYVNECLTHRIYCYYFAHSMFWSMAQACAVYGVFLNLSLGITLKQIGMLAAVVSFAQLILNYPAGMLADRFHPLRVLVWMKIALAVVLAPLNFVWLFGNFSPLVSYRILIGLAAVELPLGLMYVAVMLPTAMRVFPKPRFGQFCSFNAIAGAGISIAGSFIAAWFMTMMRRFFPDDVWGKDYCYRLIPAWKVPFLLIALVFLLLLYREWKRLGGEKNYVPPGFEEEKLVRVDENSLPG